MSEQKEKRRYTREFKIEAVRLYEASGKSMRAIKQELGITPCLLSKWVQQFRVRETAAFPGKGQVPETEAEVQRMCKVLSVCASGYSAWQPRPVSQRAQANEKLLPRIRAIHSQSRKTYGSPRVQAELKECGFKVGKNRVARLMRRENLRGQRKKKQPRTTNSQHSHPVAPNRLNREFHASRPNEKMVSRHHQYPHS